MLQETYLSADDLRINLWHMEITDQSFNIVDIKPANMEELTEVITASEFHPKECNLFVYSSSKGTIRLCDMRQVQWGESGLDRAGRSHVGCFSPLSVIATPRCSRNPRTRPTDLSSQRSSRVSRTLSFPTLADT